MAADDLRGVFVGVDSGGTRTNVLIKELDGQGLVSESSYEGADSLSGALALELIPQALRRILAPLGTRIEGPGFESLPVYIWIAAAGFTPWSRDDYFAAVNNVRSTILTGRLKSIGVGNDAVSLLLGLRADGIIIGGTGSSVIVRSADNELFQAGGHEWVASDYGSGFWIGLQAIREAYRDFEEGCDSVLLQRMHELYDVTPGNDWELIEKVRELAVGGPSTKKEIAKFTASVCAAAERGDKAAQNIVKSEAESLADVTARSFRRRFPTSQLIEGLKLVQCGSLLNNTFYRTSFEGQLEMRLLIPGEEQAHFEWYRVATASEAARQLAEDLTEGDDPHLGLGRAFRPVILHA